MGIKEIGVSVEIAVYTQLNWYLTWPLIQINIPLHRHIMTIKMKCKNEFEWKVHGKFLFTKTGLPTHIHNTTNHNTNKSYADDVIQTTLLLVTFNYPILLEAQETSTPQPRGFPIVKFRGIHFTLLIQIYILV